MLRDHRLSGLRVPEVRVSPGTSHRGQSLVEFALVLPVLLLLVVGGIDFGRVFLGWVSLNNTARIAANYAAANAPLLSAGNAAALAGYNKLVQDDAVTTNCQPEDPIPNPTYSPDAGIGGSAKVALTCRFQILTPVLSSILGGEVTVGASAIFPVRSGIVAGVPAGGPTDPVALFNVSPQSGDAPLPVSFNNVSTGSPTSYEWDYENDGTIDSTSADPPDFIYSVPGTYIATLKVSNGLVSSTASRTITVTTPPGPIANFTPAPVTGTAPQTVTFTNTSTGTITAYAWDYTDDGVVDSTLETPPDHSYGVGTWTISLTVTDALSRTSTTVRTVTFTDPIPTCTVPNFKNLWTYDDIQGEWIAAGFSTSVIFSPSRPPDFKITKQSLSSGSQPPCVGTVITVFDR